MRCGLAWLLGIPIPILAVVHLLYHCLVVGRSATAAGIRRSPIMSIITWIVLGIVGAGVGGFLFTGVGAIGVHGFNIWSMFVAYAGAVMGMVFTLTVVGRSRAHI